MNKNKMLFLVGTGLLSAMMLMSASMYVFNYAYVAEEFIELGFPTYLIYPLALAKTLGVLAIWLRPNPTITNLAYAGFFYDFILAFTGHLAVGDDEFFGALIALALLGLSFFYRKARDSKALSSAGGASTAAA